MAKTRLSLEKKLSELKRRFTTSRSAPKKRKITMATKKTAPKSVKTAMSKTKTGAKKATSKVMKKTKEVLGEMLEGAATGAIKGAVEALEKKGKKGSTKAK
jgi:hypothetical protein